MQRIIETIEAKLRSDECTIYCLQSQVDSLKQKLENAEKVISEQQHIINQLKGETA